MSKKSESEIRKTIASNLEKRDFKILPEYKSTSGSIDVLAQKGNYLFAIEVKNHPIETFDIVRSSTIVSNLKQNPEFKTQNVVGVLTSGSAISLEAKDLGKKIGVVVTEPLSISDSLSIVLTGPDGKIKARRKT